MSAKRRIMVKAKLDEISAVDKPAQPDAKMVLRKRHDGEEPINKNSDESSPADSSAPNHAGESQSIMTPEQILALQKRVERAEKALKLNAAEREVFLAKSETEQDAFLQLDASLRLIEVQKAASSNPVVYTDGKGREFRKNDDPRMVELAKDADESRKERALADGRARLERVAKRAAELKHLPGEPANHVLLIEAVEKLDSAEQQDKALSVLKSLDADFAKAFERKGTTAAPVATSTAETKIEAIAKSLREKNPKLTEAQAYSEAMKTPEGQAAYAEHIKG